MLPWVRSLRRRVNALFDTGLPSNRVSWWFSLVLGTLIVINVGSVILESVESLRRPYGLTFWWIEQVATVVFSVEYGLRVWSAPDRSSGQFRRPILGRLLYASRPFALIDLLSILPAVLGVFGADDLRVLRLLRLMRMLKLSRHSTVFALLYDVVREEARTIGAVLFILLINLTLSASLMYLVEGEVQPQVFSSIPAAMWWAIETLTTVGYGDAVPITPLGKILGGLVALFGIGTVALFTGVITVSFMDQLRLRRGRLRHLAAGLETGPLTPAEVATVARMGAQMGVPAADAQEIVEELSAGPPGLCPHCGQAFTPTAAEG
jgi:voltage-gated potassium channel